MAPSIRYIAILPLSLIYRTNAILWRPAHYSTGSHRLPCNPGESKSSFRYTILTYLTASLSPQNWKKEFIKWLGKDRIRVFTAESKQSVKNFVQGARHWHVLIIGYERVSSFPGHNTKRPVTCGLTNGPCRSYVPS